MVVYCGEPSSRLVRLAASTSFSGRNASAASSDCFQALWRMSNFVLENLTRSLTAVSIRLCSGDWGEMLIVSEGITALLSLDAELGSHSHLHSRPTLLRNSRIQS